MRNFFNKSKPKLSNIENGAAFRVAEHIVLSFHEDGIVLLDSRKGLLFTGNRVASTIWAGVSQRRTFEKIAECLSKDHGLSPECAVDETRGYLLDLHQRGFVFEEARN